MPSRPRLLRAAAALLAILLPAAGAWPARADAERAVPASVRHALAAPGPLETVVLEPLDREALARADEAVAGPGVPLRIGVARELPELFLQDGRLEFVPEEAGWLWRIRIVAHGAEATRLRIERLDLASDSTLIVHSGAAEAVFRGRGPNGDGDFWTWGAEGPEALAEWFAPGDAARPPEALPFRIAAIMHDYRDFEGLARADWEREGDCHLDPTCQSAWLDQRNAAAKITFVDGGNQYICSGTMLNDTAQDGRPFFLTAHHCISTQTVANTIKLFFFFHSTNCNVAPSGQGTRKEGSTLRATSAASDFTLLELDSSDWTGIYFAGWDRTMPTYNQHVTSIHHPDGAWKRISFGRQTGLINNFIEMGFDDGATEGGSSGGALFLDSNHRTVGQLLGVYVAGGCDYPYATYIYGRFDKSYNSGAGSWLGNATSVDGRYWSGGSPSATPTPTRTPTAPPCTATPTPAAFTPTPTPTGRWISIMTNAPVYHPGDEFVLTTLARNPEEGLLVDQYVALDVYGFYFFWPSWGAEPDCQPVLLDGGRETSMELLRFDWPDGAGVATGIRFWAAILHAGTAELAGGFGTCSFDFE